MAHPSSALKRRGLLRGIAAAGAVVIAASVVACGSPHPGGSGGSGGPASTVPNGTLVMIIRHGEKPGEKKTGDEPGVDENGAPAGDSSLTETGWQRAHGLVNVFAPDSGQLRPGLARPVAIFSAGANDAGEGERTRETIAPLAKKLGIQPDTSFGKGEEAEMIAKITSQPGPTLICWQHGEIPDIAEAFGDVSPTPPSKWPDSVYDVIWTLTKTSDGWAFAQQPEMVLPSDDDKLIKE